MPTLRLKPTSYDITRQPYRSFIQNPETILNGADPEDACNGSYLALKAASGWSGGSSDDCPFINIFFACPSGLVNKNITKISMKTRMISYGNSDTSFNYVPTVMLRLDTSHTTNYMYQGSHVNSAADAQTYMNENINHYDYYDITDSSFINNFKANLSDVNIRINSGSYNQVSYFSGFVLDIEYDGSDDLKIGTNKLKDAFMGSNLIRKIYKGTKLLFKPLNIPEAYQEVEYVTFHGKNSGVSSTEYIDTGVVPSATKGFFLDADVIGASGCTGWGSGADNARTIFRGSSTDFRIQADNVSAEKTYQVTGRHVWTIDYYNQKMGYDNTLDSMTIAQYGVLNFYLGAWYEAGTTYYGMGGKVYSFKIYDSGNLSVNYVPCYRKSDGVIGFYDTINKQFKINEGTGSFTKGPDVI